MDSICLDRVEVNRNLVKFYYSVSEGLKRYFNSDVMFLEYEQDMSAVPLSILTIPFVSCMAGLSWLSNSMLFVDEIDRSFYDSFFRIKRAYQELHYDLSLLGLLVPSKFTNNVVAKSNNSLLLFGGGVDCHCSFLRNQDSICRICSINGWLNSPTDINDVDILNKKAAGDFAKANNVDCSYVRTNFSAQFNNAVVNKVFKTSYWYVFLHSMAFISISIPLCYANNISNIIIASSFTKNRIDVMCSSLITTDSEFAFSTNGCVIHDAYELNRQQKVGLLVNYQKESQKPYPINVCSFHDKNCNECEKCFRTVLAIVAEGGDPRDFGFNCDIPLKEHWAAILEREIGLWGVEKEDYYYYYFTRKRMNQNYDNIQDKDFADWFLALDLQRLKKIGVINYYKKNFISIILRKFFHIKCFSSKC